ncbi:MAG: sel1 repeat family protein [Muribaculaceae bacterium]|nr:sel1 repeat family protein [Muribaculaceae bacterium]
MKSLLYFFIAALAFLPSLFHKAEQGDPEALFRLSMIYENGLDSIAPDSVKSIALLRKSAAAGYAPARNYLGFLFKQGRFIRQNDDSARFWIKLAADDGDPKAANNLAFLLLNNENPADDSLAVRYLNSAVNAGLPVAMTTLGSLYAEGRGVEKDTTLAVSLFNQAISLGFNDAQLRLLNLMGKNWLDLPPADRLELAIGYWNMGSPLIGVELLRELDDNALTSLTRPELAKAYAILGHAYSHGAGIAYDHALANRYFAKAALLGDPAAQYIFAETLDIFPDAFADIFSQNELDALVSDGMDIGITASELRQAAALKGINDARSARRFIFSPLEKDMPGPL